MRYIAAFERGMLPGCAGQNDALVDLAWQPGRNALCTLGASGRVYLWAAIYKEDWNAFAPDYTTLDYNQVGAVPH